MQRFLINASNLHVGGGIQVASSFLHELARSSVSTEFLAVLASNEVNESLDSLGAHSNLFSKYEICDIFGLGITSYNISRQFTKYESVFTIFGPLYRWRTPFKSIVGFAQPWIIYPKNECYKMLPLHTQLTTRIKYWVQGLFFKRADVIVVELEHVKQRLISVLGIPAERIHVIKNCISSIYRDESFWQPVNIPNLQGCLRLGFLGRNYLHKNTSIFPAIVAELERAHGIRARFYVTFTAQEWAACTPEFRAVCFNVGLLSVAQCPRFYQALDGVVFPSLLECFSASPLEAMVMEKPLFASDRPFNRDVCGRHAHYFDPLLPETAAQAIANVFVGGGPNPDELRAGRDHAIHFSSPKERAERYLAVLMGDSST